MRQTITIAFLCISVFASAQKASFYTKSLKFPPSATENEKIEMAARLVPSKEQLEWQKMELTAFLHYGINTFTGNEWGSGKEDPALFCPKAQDAEQWVKTLKLAGFKMAILTAKHHDGFCLWQTATTSHSVASSPWKNGKGDIMKELSDACHKYGLKFGVYLSPWDRNAPCYGKGQEYNDFFIAQLTELLTKYGEVNEVWFDGANGEGPNGKKQEYDWERILETIHKLQPNAVTAIMGDDVRWCGNERGLGRATEWSATVLMPSSYKDSQESNSALGISSTSKDLGSRDMIGKAERMFWYPSEVDVSIRPGWFYHASQDAQVKSLSHLENIYFQSVGCNSVLLLNIPPDTNGKINAADSTRLMELRHHLDNIFNDNKVRSGKKSWKAKAEDAKDYKLTNLSAINAVMLKEDISRGQRIEAFEVEALSRGYWKKIAEGTTVGYKRLLRFPTIATSSIRIKIKSCRLVSCITEVGAYYVPQTVKASSLASVKAADKSKWRVLSESPLTIDLGQTVSLKGFEYAPEGAEAKATTAVRYKFYSSRDGKSWSEQKTSGEFSNIMNNPTAQIVGFKNTIKARFIKIESQTNEDNPAIIKKEEIKFIDK